MSDQNAGPWLPAQAAAAVAAGLTFSWGMSLPYLSAGFALGPMMSLLGGVAIVVPFVAALVPALPRVVRFGPAWAAVATGAAALLAAHLLWRLYIGMAPLLGGALLAVTGLGLVLGGTLLAAGAASGRGRLAIVAGLTAGLVAAPPLQRVSADGPTEIAWSAGSVVPHALAVAVVAAVAAIAVIHDRRTNTSLAAAQVREPAFALLGVSVAAVFVDVVCVIGLMLTPPADPYSGRLVGDAWAPYAAVALSALIVFALSRLVDRRARSLGSAWVLTGAAVGLALPGTGWYWTAHGPSVLVVSLLAAAGAVAGALGARFLGRYLAWDAVGVLMMAVASGSAWPSLRWLPAALLAGSGVAMGAALVMLARGTTTLTAAEFVGASVPGFAAVILVGQVLGPVVQQPPDELPARVTMVVVLAVVASALVALRRAARSPRP
jgi:hypothetical protein